MTTPYEQWTTNKTDTGKAIYFFKCVATEQYDLIVGHLEEVFPILVNYLTGPDFRDKKKTVEFINCLENCSVNLDFHFRRTGFDTFMNSTEPRDITRFLNNNMMYSSLVVLFNRLSPAIAAHEFFIGQDQSIFTQLVKHLPDADIRSALSTILRHIAKAPDAVRRWHGSACSSSENSNAFYSAFATNSRSLSNRYKKLAGLATDDGHALFFGDSLEIEEVLLKSKNGKWIIYSEVTLSMRVDPVCLKKIVGKELALAIEYMNAMSVLELTGVAILISNDSFRAAYYLLVRTLLSNHKSKNRLIFFEKLSDAFLHDFFNWLKAPGQSASLRETLSPVLDSPEREKFFDILIRAGQYKGVKRLNAFDYLCDAEFYTDAQLLYVLRPNEVGIGEQKTPPVNSALYTHMINTLSAFKQEQERGAIAESHKIRPTFVRAYLLDSGFFEHFQPLLDAAKNHSPLFALHLWKYFNPEEQQSFSAKISSHVQGYEKALMAFQHYTSSVLLNDMPSDYRLHFADQKFLQLIKTINDFLRNGVATKDRRDTENILICIITHLPDNELLLLLIIAQERLWYDYFASPFVFQASVKHMFSKERSVDFRLRAFSISIIWLFYNDPNLSEVLSFLKGSSGESPEVQASFALIMKEHHIAKMLVESGKLNLAKQLSDFHPDLFKTDDIFSPEHHVQIMLQAREKKPTRQPFLPSAPTSNAPAQTETPSSQPQANTTHFHQ